MRSPACRQAGSSLRKWQNRYHLAFSSLRHLLTWYNSIVNLFLRIVAITLFIILHSYWRLKDKGIEKALDFGKNPLQSIFHKSALSYAQVIVLLQLTGLRIFPFPSFPPVLQLVTVSVSVTGLTICIVARRALGNNWINAKDYQLCKNPQLVTNGVYTYIRHPIYLGVNSCSRVLVKTMKIIWQKQRCSCHILFDCNTFLHSGSASLTINPLAPVEKKIVKLIF